MANRNFASGGKIYAPHSRPVLVDCNFVVDSTNGNGLGIRNLKGPLVQNVFMSTTAAPGLGNSNLATPNIPVRNPNPTAGSSGPAPGSPNLATSASYVLLAHSSITNTGSSVATGNLGLYPGTSVTGFPPGVVIGTQNITNAAAQQAAIDATAAYTDLSTRSATTIPAILDGQTLTAGVYSVSGGAGTLANSGPGTLTLNGSATDVFVIQCASTLTTGAGGLPTIAFTGGALPTNLYWAIGSSATLNVSGTGTFQGTLIANTSVTIDGGAGITRLMALNGSITIAAAVTLSLPPAQPASGGGTIIVQLQDNYNRSLCGFNARVSPINGVPSTTVAAGTPVIITSLGTATLAQWQAVGLPLGLTPAIGLSFVPTTSATIGGGATVEAPSILGSGVASIETVGDPNLSIAPDLSKSQGFGSQFILQCRSYAMADVAPADGTVISLSFYLSDSGVYVQGE